MRGAGVQDAARLGLAAASALAVPIKRLDRNLGISAWSHTLYPLHSLVCLPVQLGRWVVCEQLRS